MLRLNAILSVLLFALRSQATLAQKINEIEPSLRNQIDRIATQVVQQTGIPSASIAVVQHGKLVYTHAYGKARLQPPTPATPAMRYSIGSISKQFTAVAILLLQEQGKLSIDDPIGKYIPGLTRGDQITIRQILSHTSGYQDYWPEDYVMTTMKPNVTAQQIIDRWAKKPLDFEPGTRWQYSNTNFVIAGLIVEKVSGEQYFQFLSEHIFHPLRMKSVWNSDQTQLPPADATPYYRHALGPLRVAPKEGYGWMYAAGELAMSPHDLALWDQSMIAESVLKPESYKQMFTEVTLADGKGTDYGLGVSIRSLGGHREIEHSGEVSGFVSDNIVLVDDGAAIAVCTNQDAVNAASTIARLAAPLIADIPPSPEVKQVLDIYRQLQHGRIDRTLLAPNLSDYFTAEAIADFQRSLAPLGEPIQIRQTSTEQRGGMTMRAFEIVYPDRRLRLSTYTYPDGKLEQYLISPGS